MISKSPKSANTELFTGECADLLKDESSQVQPVKTENLGAKRKSEEISKPSPEEYEDNCSICFDRPSIKGVIPCDHIFCFPCIMKWSQTENSCPLCKKRFHYISKYPPPGSKGKGPLKTERVEIRSRDQAQDFFPAHFSLFPDFGSHPSIYELMGIGDPMLSEDYSEPESATESDEAGDLSSTNLLEDIMAIMMPEPSPMPRSWRRRMSGARSSRHTDLSRAGHMVSGSQFPSETLNDFTSHNSLLNGVSANQFAEDLSELLAFSRRRRHQQASNSGHDQTSSGMNDSNPLLPNISSMGGAGRPSQLSRRSSMMPTRLPAQTPRLSGFSTSRVPSGVQPSAHSRPYPYPSFAESRLGQTEPPPGYPEHQFHHRHGRTPTDYHSFPSGTSSFLSELEDLFVGVPNDPSIPLSDHHPPGYVRNVALSPRMEVPPSPNYHAIWPPRSSVSLASFPPPIFSYLRSHGHSPHGARHHLQQHLRRPLHHMEPLQRNRSFFGAPNVRSMVADNIPSQQPTSGGIGSSLENPISLSDDDAQEASRRLAEGAEALDTDGTGTECQEQAVNTSTASMNVPVGHNETPRQLENPLRPDGFTNIPPLVDADIPDPIGIHQASAISSQPHARPRNLSSLVQNMDIQQWHQLQQARRHRRRMRRHRLFPLGTLPSLGRPISRRSHRRHPFVYESQDDLDFLGSRNRLSNQQPFISMEIPESPSVGTGRSGSSSFLGAEAMSRLDHLAQAALGQSTADETSTFEELMAHVRDHRSSTTQGGIPNSSEHPWFVEGRSIAHHTEAQVVPQSSEEEKQGGDLPLRSSDQKEPSVTKQPPSDANDEVKFQAPDIHPSSENPPVPTPQEWARGLRAALTRDRETQERVHRDQTWNLPEPEDFFDSFESRSPSWEQDWGIWQLPGPTMHPLQGVLHPMLHHPHPRHHSNPHPLRHGSAVVPVVVAASSLPMVGPAYPVMPTTSGSLFYDRAPYFGMGVGTVPVPVTMPVAIGPSPLLGRVHSPVFSLPSFAPTHSHLRVDQLDMQSRNFDGAAENLLPPVPDPSTPRTMSRNNSWFKFDLGSLRTPSPTLQAPPLYAHLDPGAEPLDLPVASEPAQLSVNNAQTNGAHPRSQNQYSLDSEDQDVFYQSASSVPTVEVHQQNRHDNGTTFANSENDYATSASRRKMSQTAASHDNAGLDFSK